MAEFNSVFKKERYTKYDACVDGQILAEGVFKGSREGPYGAIYLIDEGEVIAALNKSGHLSFLLSKVNVGDVVQVVYKGKDKIKQGKFQGKSAHQFDVRIALQAG
jgi:hypothetical protein